MDSKPTVLGHIQCALRDPPDLQRDERAQQLLRGFPVGYEIVVDEEDQLLILIGNLSNHILNPTHSLLPREKRCDGAEVAGKPASSAELHELHRQIFLALEQVPARKYAARLRLFGMTVVDRLDSALAQVLDDLGPDRFRVASDDRIGELQTFFRCESRLKATHDHGNAALTKPGCNLVGSPRRIELYGNGGQVGGLIVRDIL